MSELRAIRIERGPQGFGGPLIIRPTEQKNKVMYITGGGTAPECLKKIVELSGMTPGFCAGKDVDAVIETQRGHNLGRVIYEGEAAPNTGIPGMIGGYAKERVIHAPATGKLHILRQIGEIVEAGDILADIEGTPVKTLISGVVRGMIREGYDVKKGLKIADVDPRVKEQENCYHISDKARCVAGGVLEAILHLLK